MTETRNENIKTIKIQNESPFWLTPTISTSNPFTIKRFMNYVDEIKGLNKNSFSRNKNYNHDNFINEQVVEEVQLSSSLTPSPKSPTSFKSSTEKISECLYAEEVVDLEKLRKLCWNGIPCEFRGVCWKMLMGYLSPNLDRHESILQRKRKEYRDIVIKYFGADDIDDTNDKCKDKDKEKNKINVKDNVSSLKDLINQAKSRPSLDFNDLILHQISIDVPRTCPDSNSNLFQQPKVQQSLLRILYCWSIRRPATGYVQGINDLVTPFYDVFFNSPHSDMFEVEADTFWCLSNLLDTIQDSYTFNQSGIYRQVTLLREISHRMDPQLIKHLDIEGIEFIQFAFRWMNCLLLREFSLPIIQRLWDSYLSEGLDGFKSFHPYVCAAFLLKWRRELQVLEFQDIIVFLQKPPTANWTDRDVEMLVAEAFVLKSLFNK